MISAAQFISKAQEAHSVGGALRLDNKGHLFIQGTTWWGRKALWLRDHLTSNRVRQQNIKLLNTLSESLMVAGKRRSLYSLRGDVGHSRVLTRRIHEMLASLQKEPNSPAVHKIKETVVPRQRLVALRTKGTNPEFPLAQTPGQSPAQSPVQPPAQFPAQKPVEQKTEEHTPKRHVWRRSPPLSRSGGHRVGRKRRDVAVPSAKKTFVTPREKF